MGIFAKIKKAWFDTIVWETIDDEFYDELEDSLIMADLGATVAHDAVKKLRDVVYQKSIQRGDDVKQALRAGENDHRLRKNADQHLPKPHAAVFLVPRPGRKGARRAAAAADA